MDINEENSLLKSAIQVAVIVDGIALSATKTKAKKLLFEKENSKWTIHGLKDGTLYLMHPEIS